MGVAVSLVICMLLICLLIVLCVWWRGCRFTIVIVVCWAEYKMYSLTHRSHNMNYVGFSNGGGRDNKHSALLRRIINVFASELDAFSKIMDGGRSIMSCSVRLWVEGTITGAVVGT